MNAGGSIKDAWDLRAYLLDRSCRQAFAGAPSARLEDLQADCCSPEAALQREALNRIAKARGEGHSEGKSRVRWTVNPNDEHGLIVKLHSHVSLQASSDLAVWPTASELDELISLLDQGMRSEPLVGILPPRQA